MDPRDLGCGVAARVCIQWKLLSRLRDSQSTIHRVANVRVTSWCMGVISALFESPGGGRWCPTPLSARLDVTSCEITQTTAERCSGELGCSSGDAGGLEEDVLTVLCRGCVLRGRMSLEWGKRVVRYIGSRKERVKSKSSQGVA